MNRMARAALESAHEARLNDLSIHQIRHTVAVKMLQAGRPLVEVSQFLGHSNIQITEKSYARFMPERFAEAADILDISRFSEPTSTSQKRPR